MASTASALSLTSLKALNFDDLLRRKNLNPSAFSSAYPELTLASPITEHGKFLYEAVYQHPYPDSPPDAIARYHHGMAHVSRVALYVPVFANLYRKCGVTDAEAITPERLKLLQIAALFHDAAREKEGKDLWDHESALMLYVYLRRRMNVPVEEAKLIAEATANKDLPEEGYFTIHETAEGLISSNFDPAITPENFSKNVYGKLIHDADCLDIQRERPHFNGRYLDLQQHIEKMPPGELKEQAIAERAQLICEARTLIDFQGDTYLASDPEKKLHYENIDGCARVFEDAAHYPLLGDLNAELYSAQELQRAPLVESLPYDPDKPLTGKNMDAAMSKGLILARGIGAPTKISPGSGEHPQTLADTELLKTMRARGIATATQKPNRMEKEGNPIRSFTMLGYGSDVFTDAGFLTLRNDAAISYVASTNSYTGTGKKSNRLELDKNQRKDPATIAAEMDALYEQLRLGGDSSKIRSANSSNNDFESSHNEILMDVHRYDAIYFSNDPNFSNSTSRNLKEIAHTSLLQAVYLRQEYARHYALTLQKHISTFGEQAGITRFLQRFGYNAWLPVFKYSKHENRLSEVPAEKLNNDEFLFINWVSTIRVYWHQELWSGKTDLMELREEDPEIVKRYALYGKVSGNFVPADQYYSPALRERINAWILEARARVMDNWENTVRQELQSGKTDFETKGYMLVAKSPVLREEFREHARVVLTKKILSASSIPELRNLQETSQKFRLADDCKPLLVQRVQDIVLPEIQKADEASDLLKVIATIRSPTDWFSESMKAAVANRLMQIVGMYNLGYGQEPSKKLDESMQALSFLQKHHFLDAAPKFDVPFNIRLITKYKEYDPMVWAKSILALESMLPSGFSPNESRLILSSWNKIRQASIADVTPESDPLQQLPQFKTVIEQSKSALKMWVTELLQQGDVEKLASEIKDFDNMTKRMVIGQLDKLPNGRALLKNYLKFLESNWLSYQDEQAGHIYTALLILSLPPQKPSSSFFFSPPTNNEPARQAELKLLDLIDHKDVSFTQDEIAILKKGILGRLLGDELDSLPKTSAKGISLG